MDPHYSLIIWQLISLINIPIFIYSLIDLIRNKYIGFQKDRWVFILLIVPFGGIFYLIFGRKYKLHQ